MCGEDVPEETRFYSIGDRLIVMEFYGYNDECGKGQVQIHELLEKDKNCFTELESEVKIKKLPAWMGGKTPVIICAEDFKSTIEVAIEQSLEKMWVDDLTDEEMNSVPTKLQEKIDKFVTKNLLKNIKGLDN